MSRPWVCDLDVERLIQKHGTPLFLFSERQLRLNARTTKRALSHPSIDVRMYYACKANSNLAILQIIRKCGYGAEVNSGGELRKAYRAGFSPRNIIFNGVAKTGSEIHDALKLGIALINIDSFGELQRVAHIGARMGVWPEVLLRVNPGVSIHSVSGVNTGSVTSKFGMSSSELREAIDWLRRRPKSVRVRGIHMHAGAQISDLRRYRTCISYLCSIAKEVEGEIGQRCTHLNVGGGIPVRFLRLTRERTRTAVMRQGMCADAVDVMSTRVSADDVAAVVQEEYLRTYGSQGGRGPRLMLEPGTKVVAEAGVLVCTVENVKRRPGEGQDWLIVDAGFSVLRDAFTYRWFFELVPVTRNWTAGTHPFRIGGPLCDGGDEVLDTDGLGRLPLNRMMPADSSCGDRVAFLDVGAYSLDQMCQYNGRCRPAAVLHRSNGDFAVIRRADRYEDLWRQDVPLGEVTSDF